MINVPVCILPRFKVQRMIFAMTVGCVEMDHLGIVKCQLDSLKDNEVSTNWTPFVTVLDLQSPLSRCIATFTAVL